MGTGRIRSRTSLAVLLGVVLAVTTTEAPSVSAAPPPYVTILFSRSQWAVQEGCRVPANAVTLGQAVADLASRGWVGTGSVVTSRIGTTSMRCTSAALYPTWSMLESLHADDGFEVTSHSATYPNMTTLTTSQQFAESCGTLPTFTDHGFSRAWGLFSYPDNHRTSEIQTDVVSTCFAYARRYAPDRNALSTMSAPWWAKVRSVNGGACNLSSAACYAIDTRYRYADPGVVANLVTVQPGQWAVAQFHKLVTGSKLSGTVRWDCTASDWRLHFTSRTELYCWNDYRRILAAIPAGAVVTDPVTVARAWGSNPDVLALHS